MIHVYYTGAAIGLAYIHYMVFLLSLGTHRHILLHIFIYQDTCASLSCVKEMTILSLSTDC